MVSLSMLEESVMSWAKEAHPTKYAQTVGVKSRPSTYRRYLQRLVEIRYKEDSNWNPPLRLLEDTNIKARYMTADGHEFEVKGRRCKGLRKMSWSLMASIVEQDKPIDALVVAMRELDMYVADTDRPHDWVIPDTDPFVEEPVEAAPEKSPPPCPVCGVGQAVDGRYMCAQCANLSKLKQGSLEI